MLYLYNTPSTQEKRRFLRKNQTEAEKVLWSRLRNRQISDLKFYCQYSVGPYILDFFCPALRLAVEIDGGQHAESAIQKYDADRTQFLVHQKIRMLRFWNNDVLNNTQGVIEELVRFIF